MRQMLFTACETACPQRGGPIDRLTPAQRLKLQTKVWTTADVASLMMKQLSHTDLDLHTLCQQFVAHVSTVDTATNSSLEQLFVTLLATLGDDFIVREARISQTARLSHALLRHVTDKSTLSRYTASLHAFLTKATVCHQRVYAVEQLAAGFVRSPARDDAIIAMLLRVNHDCNHGDGPVEAALSQAARAALLRCLDVVAEDLTQLKALVTMATSVYSGQELKGICGKVLQLWTGEDSAPKAGRKRRASDSVSVNKALDLNDKTNAMFAALLASLCLYSSTQPLDDGETTVTDWRY